jgi:hypothetical protein
MSIYHHMFPDTRNKNIIHIIWSIGEDFKILEHLWFNGDGTIPYGHDQHTIKCYLIKGKRIHRVYGISTVFNTLKHLCFTRDGSGGSRKFEKGGGVRRGGPIPQK